MARRRKTSAAEDTFDVFYDLFMHIPTWVCLPISAAVFVGLKLTLTKVVAGQYFLEALNAKYGTWLAGFFAVIGLFAGIKAEIHKRTRRKLFDDQRGLETIRNLSWSDFELLVGEAYRRLGYSVSETGGGGADGGIDLKLRSNTGQSILVQCKQWRVLKVGVKPVRELYGVLTAEKASKAIFVTTGIYTPEAQEFARGKPIELVDGESLVRLIAPIHGQISASPIDQEAGPLQAEAPSPALKKPECPVCRGEMVLRSARKGVNAGSEFWGCSNYPRCRGTRQV